MEETSNDLRISGDNADEWCAGWGEPDGGECGGRITGVRGPGAA